MAVGGAAGGAVKGAPVVLQGMVGGAAGGAVQGAGDQAIQDVKKGEVSSAKDYASTTVKSAATGAVVGGALAGGAAVVGKGVSLVKPGETPSLEPPSDPYDVAAWNKYYEQNPGAARSVGPAGADDPAAFGGKAGPEADPSPPVTKLPYVAPRGRVVNAQPTGKTLVTDHNASALAGQGRRVRIAYPQQPLHHVFPQEMRFRAYFEARGIDIHRWTVALNEGEHSAIHTMGWNRQWAEWITANPNATTDEVVAFSRQMMERFHIAHLPPVQYSRAPR
jgi:hypothetical protein